MTTVRDTSSDSRQVVDGNNLLLLYSHTYYLYYYFSYICRMKTVCIILGTVSLTLGIIGIFLPLLPTTPFLLLTAALLLQRLTQTVPMVAEPQMPRSLHPQLPREQSHPTTCQKSSPLLMWGTMVYCIFFLIPLTEIKIVLFPCRCGGDLAYTVIQDVEMNVLSE